MKRTALSILLLACPVAAETFQIDPNHSKVMFRAQHMVISKVTGHFGKFQGSFDYDAKKPEAWRAEAKIEAASVDTAVAMRDNDLRSPNFFDVEKYPAIEFKSTKVTGVKGGKAKLQGDLTIHGVTKPVVLDLEIGGVIKDPWGNVRAGATATGKINRRDFGLNYNRMLETGGLVVGNEVEIILEIEGTAAKKG